MLFVIVFSLVLSFVFSFIIANLLKGTRYVAENVPEFTVIRTGGDVFVVTYNGKIYKI